MSSLSSEYGKLLDIIDEEKENRKKSDIKKNDNKKDNVNVDKSKLNNQTESSKTKLNDYKNLDINQYTNKKSPSSSKNTEFDINEFKAKLRQKLINKYYKTREYNRPYISVTEILYCLRKAYFERMKYSVNESELFNFPQLLLIQDVGNKVHDIFQEYYNFDEVEKVLKSEEYKLKGRVDAIKNNTVFELKTVDPFEFNSINKIRDNDYKQGIVYSTILKEEYNYQINNLEVIYISRDLKNINVFKKDIDFKFSKEIMEKAKELHNCLLKSKVPFAEYDKNVDECKYCTFKKYCKSITNNEDENSVNNTKKINTFILGD